MRRSSMNTSVRNSIEALAKRYPTGRAALVPALWEVQRAEGMVSSADIADIAGLLAITAAEVREVASFYTMFALTPRGRHHIQVCSGVCCRLRGADDILAHMQGVLGIAVGETTPDGLFTLSTVECLGSCGTAPMMQIDDDYYEDLTIEKVTEIVKKLQDLSPSLERQTMRGE